MNLINKIKTFIFNSNIEIIAFSIICFFLPIFQTIIPILIIFWSTLIAIKYYSKFSIKSILTNKISILLLLFFLIHVITLIQTSNKESGFFDVETKLSFFVFPIVFSFNSDIYIRNKKILLNSFIYGCLGATIICLGHSMYHKIIYDAPWSYFKYKDLSILMHPTYFAMYLCLSIILLIQKLIQSDSKRHKVTYSILLLFFSYFILLLSSKAGLITLIFLVILSIFKNIHLSFKNILLSLIFMIGILVIVFKNDRFTNMIDSLYKNFILGNTEMESTNERLIIWGCALKQIKSNWMFGTGAGDLKFDLAKEYKNIGFTIGEENYLNAHNQYLETLLSTGFIGVAILLAILLYSVRKQHNGNNLIFLSFLIIIIVNFIFESILNNQAGIIFFCLFLCLFGISEIGKNKKNLQRLSV